MTKYNLGLPYENSPICPFAIYYQFYRELIFALESNGYYVILTDKRNPAFQKSGDEGDRGLVPVLIKMIPEQLQQNIKTIYIQDVIDQLEQLGYGWVDEFREKYGMLN